MPRVSCATCTTCIHIHVPQCHTMSYNVIQCHTMSYNVIQCHTMSYNVIQCHTMSYNVIQCHTMSYNVLSLSLALRSLGASAGTGLWTAFSNREVFIFVTTSNGKRGWNTQHTGHTWSPVCSAQHIQQCLNCTFQKWFESSEPFLLTFGYLRFHSVFLFILPPAVCDLSTCHRLHLGSPVRFKTLWERTAAVGLDHFGSTVATCI